MKEYGKTAPAGPPAMVADPFVRYAAAAGWAPALDHCVVVEHAPGHAPFPLADRGEPIRRCPKGYPFHRMKVGDFFVLPVDCNRPALRIAAMRCGADNGAQFRFRNGRCWRVA